MALVVESDKRYVNRSKAMISLNSKLKRIVMNKTTREMMIEQYKKEFEHVLLLRDPENLAFKVDITKKGGEEKVD